MEILKQFEQGFNSKDMTLLLEVFTDNIQGEELFSGEKNFSSKAELKEIYTNLFEVNPNVQCEIIETLHTGNHLVGVFRFHSFACGAQSKTLWKAQFENGKIAKLSHFSEHI